MGFRVIVNLRAQDEIDRALEWYSGNSRSAAARFLESLQAAYRILGINPFFQIRYRNIRAVSLRNFPYFLFFAVDESAGTVRILSCFHQHRNPETRPEK
jgi:toxin ParE1/3/4